MAVFPDRIVLKNSTDGEAAIVSAIEVGGTDEITQGEIVLGISSEAVKFYTRAGNGDIVSVGGTGIGATALSELSDVNVLAPLPTDGEVLTWDDTSSRWIASDPFAGIDLGDLSGVDLSTPATDGQYLAYDATSLTWKPVDFEVSTDTTPILGGDLSVGSFDITSPSAVRLAPGTGEVVIKGGSLAGKLTLNCTANSHGVSIQSPPHEAAANYTLTLPTSSGTPGQALITTDGSGVLEWSTLTGSGTVTSVDGEGVQGITVSGGPITGAGTLSVRLDNTGISPGLYKAPSLYLDAQGRVTQVSEGGTDLGDLGDVNLDPAPSDGQILAYDASSGEWVPTSVEGTGTVTSVDATGLQGISVTGGPITSAGVLDIQLDDTTVTPGSYTYGGFTVDQQGRLVAAYSGETPLIDPLTTNGDMMLHFGGSTTRLGVGGEGQALIVQGGYPSWQDLGTGGTVTSVDITPGTGITATGGPITNAGSIQVGLANSGVTPGVYENASITVDGTGRVTSASQGADPVLNLGDLSDVDLDTTAPENGQVIAYNSTSGNWEPADGGSGGGGALIGLDDLTDVSYQSGSMEPIGLDQIVFDSSDVSSGYTQKVYTNSTYGVCLGNYQTSDPDRGTVVRLGQNDIILQADGSSSSSVYLVGGLDDTNNTPGLTFSTGDPARNTGKELTFRLPANFGVNQIYTLPSLDGSEGQALTTDGFGVLSWEDAGTVYSVNDRQGLVSLGIQDMNDYEGGPVRVSWTWSTKSNNVVPESGEISTIGPDTFAASQIDATGVIRGGEIIDATGDGNGIDRSVSIAVNGDTVYEGVWGAFQNVNANRFTFAADDAWTSSVNDGDTVTIISVPVFGGTELNANDVLKWDPTDRKFKPGQIAGGGDGGVTSIIAGQGVSVDQSVGDVTVSADFVDPTTTDGDLIVRSNGAIDRLGVGQDGQVLKVLAGAPVWASESGGGGGGGGSGAGIYLTESQTASGGVATFTNLGYSGILQKVSSDQDAWVVMYSSATERAIDATRAYNIDPTPGSGVLFEAYVTAGGTVVATPGTTYLNNDSTLTEAVYIAVRDQNGVAVDAEVTFSAYGLAAITAVSGGTFGSGL